ncbi:iron-containing alcohol dehydrogenase [Propionivibrio limicola]|uniref:iron-containing alcohol dehydrogenase n=1 Tax=Propionivibrio limicola TaxID=167645 RepID=UPI00129179E6|nr:iron-containing alcohol dehydrogenase [Propionivibrio limicola]
MKFTYSNPTALYFGQGKIAAIAKAIDPAKKVLVIYGGGSIKANGVYDQVAAALDGRQWLEFSGVEPNPTVETLDKAVALIRKEGVDFILAVGGGSVIDGSKYVAAAACYDGDGWDILTGRHRVSQALPLGAVLTLPATGSESNGGAVITRKTTKEKLVFSSDAVFPRFAVLDPDVIKSLPERQIANGIVDAFVHVCEQYLTYPAKAWVQDGYAEVLLRNLANLATQFKERDSDSWRANFMWTANQALNGLIGAGVPQDWATHMIGHELTARYGLDHARTLAIVLPSLLRNQIENKRVKLAQMGRNVFGLIPGLDLSERAIASIEDLFRSLDVPVRLSEAGINDPEAADAISAALRTHGMEKLGERGAVTLEVVRDILVGAA